MKHFAKLNCVVVQLDFPKEWGDPHRIVGPPGNDGVFHEVISELWRNLLATPPPDDVDIAAAADVSNDVDCVRFEVTDFNGEIQLDDTIDWVNEQLCCAYRIICNREEQP